MSQEAHAVDVDSLRRLFEAAEQANTTAVKYIARAAGVAGVPASVLEDASEQAGVSIHIDRDERLGPRTASTDGDDVDGQPCAEAGCDSPGMYLSPADDGYVLTCGEHPGDTGIDLEAFDWRDYDDEGDAPSVRRLGLVGNVRELWLNEWERGINPSDGKTASLMIRGEDGELVAESERYNFPGIWALVCVDAPDDSDRYVRDDSPELPEWVEWVRCDPPMDHHVRGVRCSECGETYEDQFPTNPADAARREWWTRLYFRHRADCSRASDRDKEVWFEKQRAIEIRARPDPRVMALDCLWEEMQQLKIDRVSYHHGYVDEAAEDRFHAIFRALRSRMVENYPECPDCGGEIEREDEWGLKCRNHCGAISDEVYQWWWEQHRRLYGTAGQGDRGWSVPEEARY